eukprot:EG_transcript_26628
MSSTRRSAAISCASRKAKVRRGSRERRSSMPWDLAQLMYLMERRNCLRQPEPEGEATPQKPRNDVAPRTPVRGPVNPGPLTASLSLKARPRRRSRVMMWLPVPLSGAGQPRPI